MEIIGEAHKIPEDRLVEGVWKMRIQGKTDDLYIGQRGAATSRWQTIRPVRSTGPAFRAPDGGLLTPFRPSYQRGSEAAKEILKNADHIAVVGVCLQGLLGGI